MVRERGWDSPADLEKDPATIPTRRDAGPEAAQEIEAHMALYPDRRSAALPALAAAQRVHGWCSPEAIEQAACVMRVTPAELDAVVTFYDMLETEPVGATACTCARTSPARCAARMSCTRRCARRRGEDAAFNVRAFECLGACDIAPMASVDGVYVGPLTIEDVPRLLEDVRAGRDVLPGQATGAQLVADPNANSSESPPRSGAAARDDRDGCCSKTSTSRD